MAGDADGVLDVEALKIVNESGVSRRANETYRFGTGRLVLRVLAAVHQLRLKASCVGHVRTEVAQETAEILMVGILFNEASDCIIVSNNDYAGLVCSLLCRDASPFPPVRGMPYISARHSGVIQSLQKSCNRLALPEARSLPILP